MVPPLYPLYNCPYAILYHSPSSFTIQVPRRDHRRQLPQGLHSSGRQALQPALLQQTTGFMPGQPCCNQVGLIFRPAGFFAFLSGTATKWSWNRFPIRRGGFCTPVTGSTFTASTDAVPVPSMGTAKEVGPLTSSPASQGQSPGGSPVESCLHPW
jgi:hypothetical protein